MADEDGDLVSNVRVTGTGEATTQLQEFGDKGAAAFDKLATHSAASSAVVEKSTGGIERNSTKASASLMTIGRASIPKLSATTLKGIEKAASDLSRQAVRTAKDMASFATRVSGLVGVATAAAAGIAALGVSMAKQVSTTTSAFEQNNQAQQRAVAANLSATQSAIQYREQQVQLNRQLASGAIDYDTYSTTLRSNQQARKDQIRVTAEMAAAEESARLETEKLQKQAADNKAFQGLVDTFGGPLTSSLIQLGNVVIQTKNQFIQSFGPGLSSLVDTLTQTLTSNGQAVGNFFSAAGEKISAFVSQNGPAIQKALSSIGTAAASIFDGLIAAVPGLLNFFNNQLVPAFRAVGEVVDSLVQGFNSIFGTNFTTGAAVVIVALTTITGGFKTLRGVLSLIQPAFLVFRILFTTLLGPVGLLVAAFVALYFAIDWQKFGANAAAAGQSILDFFSNLPSKIIGFFTSIFDTVKGGWDTLAQAVVDAWSVVTDFFSGLPDTVGGIFTSIGDAIKSAFTSAFDAVKSYVTSWVESIKSFLQPLIDMINVIAGGVSGAGDGGGDGFARGGHIRGRGTSTSDSIPAWLSDNEFVVRAKAVRRYGVSFMRAVNEGRFNPRRIVGFAAGGLVQGLSLTPPRFSSPFAPSGGSGSVLNLSIDGQSFNGLRIPDSDTADSLARYAVQRQMTSAGRKPSWTIPRR